MSEENKLERFGKFLILDHLVDGGMAKICRARFIGEQADKIVAIKMVQEQFSKDPQFKQMFLDELKVSFGLIHPNIAQTYDYGMYEEQLYTSMEYVDGANLKQFLDRLKERNFVFPVGISVHIVSQVCQGLGYAHNHSDKLTGKKLNLIHRDISPHNIMLTYDGAVKVIDFGIAKAETNSEATQAGTIKGKLSYLAPEYLEGMELDHRYDQFAVGITLWEMLCSRKLFQANNDLAVLKQIQACKIPPPSSINHNVPKELDQIVLKALSKDRKLRFKDMEEFNRALVKFLYSNYPDFNATDLSYFAKELFKTEIKSDRKKLMEYGKIDMQPYLADLQEELSGGGKSKSISASSGDIQGPKKPQVIELDTDDESDGGLGLALEGSTKSSGSGVTKVTKRASGPGTRVGMKNPNSTRTNLNSTRVLKNGGTRTGINKTKIRAKQKQSSGGSGFSSILLVAAALAAVAYFKPELVKKYTGIDPNIYISKITGKAPVKDSTVQPKAKQKILRKGILTLSGVNSLTQDVWINGKKINYSGLGLELNEGDYELKITADGHQSFVTNFSINKENLSPSIEVPELLEARIGALSTSRGFNPGHQMTLDVNGTQRKFSLPLQNKVRMPAGEYRATIENISLGTEKTISFVIEEDKETVLE